ncbi:PHYH [Branchiostoma lanceolatum]|uniref:PHYH protein n=1 Tax=Branchiostoma lanceolatum TaxID=7740 RepID=A0A8J9YTR3_BRALA|nr:PHYH [Branchiostoma lanceolatum]
MPESEYHYTGGFKVTDEVKADFEKNGYVIIRSLMSGEEMRKLTEALESDDGVKTKTYGRDDTQGRKTKTVLWNNLLGGEVYHYHSKVIMKEARTGGAHLWHQDYGYWYENGCMYPTMGTVWIAVDKADRENGCLKIIPGSHKAGRVDHSHVGDQAGADLERVSQLEKALGLFHVEINPGDALFFHSNILHRSDQNSSDRRRWAFLVAYNRADNNPVYRHHHPQYTPLSKLPNSAIMECSTATDLTGKDFFSLDKDFSLGSLDNKA